MDSPILNDLGSQMRCGIFTNASGEILVVHDHALPAAVDYIEYDSDSDQCCLVYNDGRMQNLGVSLNQKVRNHIQHGSEVTLAYLENKKIKSTVKVVFLIRSF